MSSQANILQETRPCWRLQVPKEELKKLFVHSVPQSAEPADLLQLFEPCTCARPVIEGDMKNRKGTCNEMPYRAMKVLGACC